jgi:Tfp pilus assembly ATPase PilU
VGHFVLASMSTVSATDTVSQLIELFPPHERPQIRGLLARALRGIICQRLLPRAGGRGRVPAVEVLVVNNGAAEALLGGQTDRLEGIMREGEYYEMQTFDQSLLNLYRRGLVERAAALHHATSAPALRVELEQVDRTRGEGLSTPASAPLAPPGPPPGARPGLPPGAMPSPGGAPLELPASADFAPPAAAPIAAD